MIVRNFAEFRSTLPTESGEIGRDGDEKYARPVADAIRELLQGLGYEADAPMDAGIDGWEFEVRVKAIPRGADTGARSRTYPPTTS